MCPVVSAGMGHERESLSIQQGRVRGSRARGGAVLAVMCWKLAEMCVEKLGSSVSSTAGQRTGVAWLAFLDQHPGDAGPPCPSVMGSPLGKARRAMRGAAPGGPMLAVQLLICT